MQKYQKKGTKYVVRVMKTDEQPAGADTHEFVSFSFFFFFSSLFSFQSSFFSILLLLYQALSASKLIRVH